MGHDHNRSILINTMNKMPNHSPEKFHPVSWTIKQSYELAVHKAWNVNILEAFQS